MPKPGLSVITVRKSVYDRLRALAESRGLTISRFLERSFVGQSQDSPKSLALSPEGEKRAGWDSNPRFAAPQAAVLVLARLPAR